MRWSFCNCSEFDGLHGSIARTCDMPSVGSSSARVWLMNHLNLKKLVFGQQLSQVFLPLRVWVASTWRFTSFLASSSSIFSYNTLNLDKISNLSSEMYGKVNELWANGGASEAVCRIITGKNSTLKTKIVFFLVFWI